MKRIILAAVIAALAMPAFAQTPRPAPPRIGGPIGDVLDKINPGNQPGPLAGGDGIKNLLAKPFLDLANFIGEDANEAISLATAVPGLQDGHGQGCWIATRKFAAVLKVHPVPLTLKAQTDLEALRLLSMAANDLCGNPHCTQVFADLATGIQTAAPIGFSIPIPSLHDICAKIPQVAVVDPVLPVPPDPGAPSAPAPAQTAPTTNPNP